MVVRAATVVTEGVEAWGPLLLEGLFFFVEASSSSVILHELCLASRLFYILGVLMSRWSCRV